MKEIKGNLQLDWVSSEERVAKKESNKGVKQSWSSISAGTSKSKQRFNYSVLLFLACGLESGNHILLVISVTCISGRLQENCLLCRRKHRRCGNSCEEDTVKVKYWNSPLNSKTQHKHPPAFIFMRRHSIFLAVISWWNKWCCILLGSVEPFQCQPRISHFFTL